MTTPWGSSLVYDRVLVTGAGSGAGRATAIALASLGATVFATGRRLDRLEQTAELAGVSPGKILPLSMDVRDPESVAACFKAAEERGGRIPALVHCAGSVDYKPAKDIDPSTFREVVESFLIGAFNTVHRWASPLIQAGEPGVAVALTGAVAAQGASGTAHSSAAKAGVEAMFRSMAREWGPLGIRLNLIGPGFYVVERTSGMWEDEGASAGIRDLIALQRPGTVDEITGPILFLLTEAASYMTGATIVPDGGFRLTPLVLPAWRFK